MKGDGKPRRPCEIIPKPVSKNQIEARKYQDDDEREEDTEYRRKPCDRILRKWHGEKENGTGDYVYKTKNTIDKREETWDKGPWISLNCSKPLAHRILTFAEAVIPNESISPYDYTCSGTVSIGHERGIGNV